MVSDTRNFLRDVIPFIALLALACKGRSTPIPDLVDAGSLAEATRPCDETLRCESFDSDEDVLRSILALHPTILAMGESHAPKGAPRVPDTAERVLKLLPSLPKRTTSFLLELWLAPPRCSKVVAATQSAQKEITALQAPTVQNHYVLLAKAAEASGVRAKFLEPTCQDLEGISDAGTGDVDAMLRLVRRKTESDIVESLGRANRTSAQPDGGEQADRDPLVVAFGGALHNDAAPREGREAWTFGPTLMRAHGTRYIELDWVVPEFVSDAPHWKALSWVPHFSFAKHGSRPIRIEVSPNSYVVIFGRTASRAP